jgi:very-short-patch-repair endonuclease
MPGAELAMWQALRDRRLGGHKFIRQGAIGSYFGDFVCRDACVVVEIDGATHSTDDELAYDRVRTAYLEDHGYRVFRAHNIEVVRNLDGVLRSLLQMLEAEH